MENSTVQPTGASRSQKKVGVGGGCNRPLTVDVSNWKVMELLKRP